MTWDQRSYYRPSQPQGPWERVKAWAARAFGPEGTILDWSVPLYTLFGIHVRLHLILILMIVGELAWSMGSGATSIGLTYMAIGMASLFILVLLHEYGHCFACRYVGGEADQIVMWPLGGLAMCRPPHAWRADLITTLGGPGVNLALAPLLAGGLLAAGQPTSAIVFNPLDPGVALGSLRLSDNSQPLWLVALWWFHFTNALLFLFNMLLPMYPMDAGRTLQGILWARMGYAAATRITVNVGLVTAVVLFVFAITGNQSRLLAIALFGGITCWMEKRRLQMMGDGFFPVPDAPDHRLERQRERLAKRREKEQAQAAKDQAELDRILAKIASEGMGSLSAREKKWLQSETNKRRGS